MPLIELLARRPLAEGVSHFAFRATYRHRAGQYVALSAVLEGGPQRRYYSIASPPRPDGRVEFCIRHHGAFGRHLLDLGLGQAIESSLPAGRMRLRSAERETVYFAAGTGVSPMRAILLAQLQSNPGADATFVLGARRAAGLLYHDEIRALRARHPGLRLLATVSGEARSWAGLAGRVTAHVDDALAGRTEVDAYFCGPPAMVADLRAQLAARGIPDSRQCFERY